MGTIYTVVPDMVSSYSKPMPGPNYSQGCVQVRIYRKGQEVDIESTTKGYGKITGMTAYINLTYLKASGNSKLTSQTGPDQENWDTPMDSTLTGTSNASYDKLILRYIRAFGSPPRYTEQVDPYYSTDKNGVLVGRAMANTWFSDPSILSLCPGTVDYLPGFSSKDKDTFFNLIKGTLNGDVLANAIADRKNDLNGKLYEFKSAYRDYMNVVNLLARTSANLLGIGDVSDIIDGSNIKLKNFDYGYYTNASSKDSIGHQSIFSETKNALNTAVSDGSYIHFFVNHTTGVDASDNFSTDAGESWLEKQFGSDSTLSDVSQNIQFLFGGAITPEANADITKLLQSATDQNELLGGISTIAVNYVKGGRLVFPKMISGMRYEKTVSVELQFTSVYGDKRSIFKYTILPALHLLALATPRQMSGNMYTYPFLVRCYQRGNVNCDLAFISGLTLSRGGSDNTSWTVDGLPTEITARFNITPLYSNMMVTSSRNPYMFFQNTALLEYLGTMCGLDLKVNNLSTKLQLAKDLIGNVVMDTPTNWARGFADTKIVNAIRNFSQITN